ncbi:MAG: cob(I)yrinic acid a,c-diamide adenosyltransferase [Gemmatimonadota bacterium]
MKIYTRSGDQGETALFGGGRVRKDHLRVETYGEIDELNATIGLAVVPLEARGSAVVEILQLLQEDLFAIGAHLATPTASSGGGPARHLPALPGGRVAQMESWIDAADEDLAPLRNFILPGGTEAAARLHLARTVCRRAERRVLTLAKEAPVDGAILIYLNRLSDLLFALARSANRAEHREDVPWAGRNAADSEED